MKTNRIATFTAAVLLSGGMVQAAHVWDDPGTWWGDHFTTEYTSPLFTAQELSLDLFGSYINPERSFGTLFQNSIHEGAWGGGVGLNYFLLREVGFGADVNLSDHSGRIVDQVVGNIILRLPIESLHLAPYIFGGGGRGISPEYEWVYDAGAGLEVRINPTTGIFADARYIWADETFDRLVIRVGLRIVF